jgi:hypothetical protein
MYLDTISNHIELILTLGIWTNCNDFGLNSFKLSPLGVLGHRLAQINTVNIAFFSLVFNSIRGASTQDDMFCIKWTYLLPNCGLSTFHHNMSSLCFNLCHSLTIWAYCNILNVFMIKFGPHLSIINCLIHMSLCVKSVSDAWLGWINIMSETSIKLSVEHLWLEPNYSDSTKVKW